MCTKLLHLPFLNVILGLFFFFAHNIAFSCTGELHSGDFLKKKKNYKIKIFFFLLKKFSKSESNLEKYLISYFLLLFLIWLLSFAAVPAVYRKCPFFLRNKKRIFVWRALEIEKKKSFFFVFLLLAVLQTAFEKFLWFFFF